MPEKVTRETRVHAIGQTGRVMGAAVRSTRRDGVINERLRHRIQTIRAYRRATYGGASRSLYIPRNPWSGKIVEAAGVQRDPRPPGE